MFGSAPAASSDVDRRGGPLSGQWTGMVTTWHLEPEVASAMHREFAVARWERAAAA